MKTIISLITLLFISCSFVLGQTLEEKERELFEKHGVKERTKLDFRYKAGKPVSLTGTKSSVSLYNKNGLVLKTYIFGLKGDTVTIERYEYDEHGNRTFYERESVRGAYKKASEYDDEDKVIKETGYDGSMAFKTIYKYDSKDRVTEITYYSENLLDEKRVYDYTGNTATVSVLHKGKDLKSTVKLKFNERGDITEERVISLDGVELEKRTMEYNSKGLKIKESKYRRGELAYTTMYTYNDIGDLVKITEDSRSKGKFDKKLYTYDDKGRVATYKWKRKPDEEYNIKKFSYGSNGVCTEEFTHYLRTDYKLLSKYEYEFY